MFDLEEGAEESSWSREVMKRFDGYLLEKQSDYRGSGRSDRFAAAILDEICHGRGGWLAQAIDETHRQRDAVYNSAA